MNIDFLFRPLAIKEADEKSTTGNAPVYMYVFTWQSPVLNASFKAVHCKDLPFVFNNTKRFEEMTGGGTAAYLQAEKVSKAWISVAKNGDPNNNCCRGGQNILPKMELQ